MFANLKNKIFEEVKASPQKLQQFAQAAQAAVSSASSNTSESASGTDNFFSITEEDTPQNSPQKRLTNKSSNEGIPPILSNVPLNISTNGPTGPRIRRLSNSSAASDVSFRLPTYDSPAVYHLQSDLDISASEVEDSVGATFPKLEHITKEHLYDAYKKALTRYQKYRSRYTDLANRYKELERDNGKARQVLVDTQDKAIRRISELKEQCSLEQQAKSHLEEALRMEMDDMQCKIKSYQTKLKLLGENSEVADHQNNQNLIHLKPEEPNLISLDAENSENINKGENLQDLQNQIQNLEKQLSEQNNCIDDMRGKMNEYEILIENLKKREEENLILLAQNKLMVHSELENKESEVKMLKSNLVDLENKLKQSQKNQSLLKSKIAEIDELQENLKKATISKQDLEAKVISSEHIIGELKQDLKDKENLLQNQKAAAEEKRKTLLADFDGKLNELRRQNEELNEMLRQSNKSEIELAEIDNELNRIKIENVGLRANADKARDENETLIVQMTAIKSQLDNSEKLLKESQEREAALLISEFTLKEELDSLRKEVGELKILQEPEQHSLQRTTLDSKEDIKQSEEFLLTEKIESSISKLASESKHSTSQTCLNILQRNLVTIAKHVDETLEKNNENEEEREQLQKLKVLLEEAQNQLSSKPSVEYEKRTSNWEIMLKEAEEKLKDVANENIQLNERNSSIEEAYNSLTTKLKDSEDNFKKEIDILNCIIGETETKYNNVCNDKKAIHNNIEQLNEKLSQVQDEKTQLFNAKEIIEKEVRSLKHQLEEKEKECACATDCKQRAEAEIQILKDEITSLRRESSNLIEISNNMRGDFETVNSELNEEKALRDKINTEYENVAKIKASLEKELKKLQGKLQLLEEEHEKSNKIAVNEIKELEKRNAFLEQQCENFKKEVNRLQQSVQEKEEQDKVKLQLLEDDHENKIKNKSNEIEELEKRNKYLEQQCENLKTEVNILQQSVQDKEEQEKIKLQLLEDEHENKIKDKANEIEELEKRTKYLEQQCEILKKEVNILQQSVQEKEEQEKVKLQLLEDDKANEIEELQKKNKYLEEQCEVLQKELSFSKQSLEEKEVQEDRAIKHQNESLTKSANMKHKNDSAEQDESQDEEMNESIRNATDLEKKLQNYDKLNMENEHLKTLLKQLETELAKSREENLQYNDDLEMMKNKNEALQNELNILNEQKENQYKEIKFLSEELESAKSTINSLSESLKMERAETKRATEQNLNATSHNEFTKKELLLVQTKLAEAEKLCGETRESYESISNKNKHLEDEVSSLSERAQALTKEVESNHIIITNLLEEQKNAEKRLKDLATIEDKNRQLQNSLDNLEVQLSQIEVGSKDNSKSEILQKLNEELKQELDDLKSNTSAQIIGLNKELEDMSTNSKCLAEKLLNYEDLEEQCSRLKEDLDSLKNTTANCNNFSDVDSIRQEKKDLENKLNKIMHEVQDVSNRNLFLEQKCENYLILEQSNVRLKLANDRLSRQLDETLVSMQHNEGIQANTEFEYLRNIMFQYLTGTVNGNSATLVKVIAAVLKFSPQQTQIVLQKEQQRHSLLGQINHLL